MKSSPPEMQTQSVKELINPGFHFYGKKIGILDREVAVMFLKLEKQIDQLRAETGDITVHGLMKDRLGRLSATVSSLRSLATRDMNKANSVLSDRDAAARSG